MNVTTSTNRHGFTIVELLVVIVVIAILAAISVVAYNGIQQRGRDSQRKSDISAIQKALEMYHVDNGGYPDCSGGTYVPGDTRGSCSIDAPALAAVLSPKYIEKVPKDPISAGDYTYRYIFGSKKVSDTVYVSSADDNYVLGVSYESQGGPYVTTWGPDTKYNYLAGSNN